MVSTRRQPSVDVTGATLAIAAGGNRALRRYMGIRRGRPSRPARAPKTAQPPATRCAAERERIRVLERVIDSLKAGRATTARRAAERAAPREQARQVNFFAPPEGGIYGITSWNNMGPAWPSLLYAREMAVKNRPRGSPGARLPPLPRFTRR